MVEGPGARHRLSRREFLSGVAASALASSGCSPSGQKDRPNVLFIAIDDLNDWIGCLGGHPDAITPHIDALASRGVLFSNAQCPAPICSPSRTSTLTGLMPHRTGVYSNSDDFRELLPDTLTLPQHFMAHGWKAMRLGKILHTYDPTSFDEGDEEAYRGRIPQYEAPLMGLEPALDWGPIDVEDEGSWDGLKIPWSRAKFAERHTKPLFFAVGFFLPHLPWSVPRNFYESFALDPGEVTLPQHKDDDLNDLPTAAHRWLWIPKGGLHDRMLAADLWLPAVAAYLTAIRYVDDLVGRLVQAWEESALGDDSIVVLWSDHGFHMGQKSHWSKYTLWEESARVPLIMAGRGVAPGICHRPVSLVDIFPTLVELCDLTPVPDLSGSSLVPLLQNPRAAREAPALTTLGIQTAVRSQHWRYIWHGEGRGEQLYDHQRDPFEWHNLALDPAFQHIKDEHKRWIPTAAL